VKRIFVNAAILVIGSVAVAWTQTAPPVVQPDPANFTGKVVGHPTTDIRMNRYSFEPGGRTNWHSHEMGQSVFVEKGRARVQERGGPIREFGPRTAFTAEPGVVHWHGALPDGPLTQVSLSFGVTNWMDKVTDDQYSGGQRSGGRGQK
jgi:quercetin dioxygenase-like cupin family protein